MLAAASADHAALCIPTTFRLLCRQIMTRACRVDHLKHRCVACAQYLCWVELVLAQVLTPNASLVGHLSGILAGLFHVYVLQGVVPGGPGRGSSAAGWLSRRLSAVRNWRRPFRGVSPSVEAAHSVTLLQPCSSGVSLARCAMTAYDAVCMATPPATRLVCDINPAIS